MKYWIRAIATAIGNGLMAPIRAAMELFGWIGQTASPSGDRDEEEEQRPLWLRILLYPWILVIGIGTLFGQVVAYPIQGLLLDPLRRRKLLCGLPALAMLLLFLGFLVQQATSSGSVQALYSKAFDDAAKENEFATARLLANQLVRNGVRSEPEVAFKYCKLLASDNDLERANAMIETLAPNDSPGYPPAHGQRAVAFAGLVVRGAGPQYLEPLLWHLNHTNDRKDERIALAWATYYRFTQQAKPYLTSLQMAAEANPEHWFSIANELIAGRDINNAKQALKNAQDAYRRQLGANPLSIPSRLGLTQALVRLQQFDDARKTIQTGMEFHPDLQEFRRAMGGLEWAICMSMLSGQRTDEEILTQLKLVNTYPDQQSLAIDQMVSLYGKTDRPEIKQEIRQIIESSSSAEPDNAVLQLALSTLAIVDSRTDDAIALLEKTLELDPKIHLAKNNLAWLLSERDPEQLDRPLQLAEEAVAAFPTKPNYLDTLGKILFQKREYERAITELERALPGMPDPDKPAIRERLAQAHEALGNTSLAETYRAKNEEKN
jgi:tetratricopeptide (TPR) repeat protein